MASNRFEQWSRALLLHGQKQLAETLRVLVYKTDPRFFQSMDFESDESFLDPLLFAWFTAPDRHMPLDRISSFVHVRSTGTNIGLLQDLHPLLDRFFVDDDGNRVDPEFSTIVTRHNLHLTIAFQLLATHCTEVMQDIAATTRQVILYRAPVPNSFASLSAHGAIFLNVPVDANEVFFLEDIAHQSAHVIFNAMTLRKEHFFTVDPYTPVAKITGNQDEPRHLYTVFHALFTYTKICRVLSKLHSCCYFSGRHAHELTGRLGFSLKKFGYDLRCLNNRALFTRAGWFFYRRFTEEYAQYMTQYGHLTHLDFSDQPYNFSYRQFALINSLNLETVIDRLLPLGEVYEY